MNFYNTYEFLKYNTYLNVTFLELGHVLRYQIYAYSKYMVIQKIFFMLSKSSIHLE